MSYLVFARRWRPKNFEEVTGQDHITKTLKNAILHNRVAHAYIFTGSRGVGKTSTARILAKALNCKDGPTPSPCNKCQSCTQIQEGNSLDVMEIDGASNRGIEEVRNLRDGVKFAPAASRFKVYIIDEVHMLTQEAFNALLKTLEEPPSHVKFIFATTQPQKVIPTIMSRCQRFDFRRISINLLIDKLKEIVKAEGLNIEEEALCAIAKASDGSLRDAESILDQLTAFSQKGIRLNDVVSVLGIVEQEFLFKFTNYIIEKDTAALLQALDNLTNSGKDISLFINNLIEHFRNLIVLKVSKDLENLIDLPKENIAILLEQSKKFAIEELLYIFYVLANTLDTIKKINMSRIPLEIALVKLTKASNIISLAEALKDISRLDKAVVNTSKDLTNSSFNYNKIQNNNPSPLKPDLATVKDGGRISLDQVKNVWGQLINDIKTKKMSVATYLSESSPVDVEGDTVIIGFPKEFIFHKEALERNDNKALIEKNFSLLLKTSVKVKFNIIEGIEPLGNAGDLIDSTGTINLDENIREDNETVVDGIEGLKSNNALKEKEGASIIKSAINIFGAKPTNNKT